MAAMVGVWGCQTLILVSFMFNVQPSSACVR